jgi:methylmalonyl-CoA/ethylmalonyl-CoA epimerase
MTSSLNHIGIAVRRIDDALPVWKLIEPGARVEFEEVPGMKVRVAKIHLANTCVELIEPLPGETAISRFLEKRGEGIHHICLQVADADEASARLKSQGLTPLYESAKDGSGGMKVNFLKPGDTRGVLIELNSSKDSTGSH